MLLLPVCCVRGFLFGVFLGEEGGGGHSHLLCSVWFSLVCAFVGCLVFVFIWHVVLSSAWVFSVSLSSPDFLDYCPGMELFSLVGFIVYSLICLFCRELCCINGFRGWSICCCFRVLCHSTHCLFVCGHAGPKLCHSGCVCGHTNPKLYHSTQVVWPHQP